MIMFEPINSIALRLANSLISTRRETIFTLYINYIWDSVRNEYIEARKKDYKEYILNRSMHRDTGKSLEVDVHSSLIGQNVSDRYQPSLSEGDNSVTKCKVAEGIGNSELNELTAREFGCPIPPMPKCIRIYQILSTVFIIYSFIRYLVISSIHYEWLKVDKKYLCYIPGRPALMVDKGTTYELPCFGLLVAILHVIWRSMWYLDANRLDLDCFLFLCYDRDTILNKQLEILKLNNPNLPPEEAYRKYICNTVFYERRIDADGSVVYLLKQHRTINHYDELAKLILKFRLLYVIFILLLVIPSVASGWYAQFSHEQFDHNYPECRSFSSSYKDNDFKWSFNDNFRYYYLFFDLYDNTMPVIETAFALIHPFGAALILCHDVKLRFYSLRRRVSKLNDRLRRLFNGNINYITSPSTVEHRDDQIKDLEERSISIFYETRSIFDHIQSVDEFVKRFASITVLGWLIVNSAFHTLAITRKFRKSGIALAYFIYAEVHTHALIASVFMALAQPYNQSQDLYTELCSAMSLSTVVVPKTKNLWPLLLDYYHPCSTRFSLHLLGTSYVLSNLNILRCLSWLFTLTVIVVNMLQAR